MWWYLGGGLFATMALLLVWALCAAAARGDKHLPGLSAVPPAQATVARKRAYPLGVCARCGVPVYLRKDMEPARRWHSLAVCERTRDERRGWTALPPVINMANAPEYVEIADAEPKEVA